MTKLFHSSPILLSPGSVIEPGNYGRIVRHFENEHALWERETVLEEVRNKHYQDKPSRLESCFACSDEQTLRFYVYSMAVKDPSTLLPVLYEVEKTNPEALEHRADFNVVQPLARLSSNMTEIAHKYWTSKLWITIAEAPNIRCEEVVTASPLRVVQRLKS